MKMLMGQSHVLTTQLSTTIKLPVLPNARNSAEIPTRGRGRVAWQRLRVCFLMKKKKRRRAGADGELKGEGGSAYV
jgi:hypothetical protein